MAQVADQFPPLDRDGRSKMFWDRNLEMYRSWEDPFWFCTSQGEYIYCCTEFGDSAYNMPHPRVWDYLVNGYDNFRSGCEQAAFYAETHDVATVSMSPLLLLELYLQTNGADLTDHTISRGTDIAEIINIFGDTVTEFGSEQKLSFEPYEEASVKFDRSTKSFVEKAVMQKYLDDAAASHKEPEDPEDSETLIDSPYYNPDNPDIDYIRSVNGYYDKTTELRFSSRDPEYFEEFADNKDDKFSPDSHDIPDDKDEMIEMLQQRIESEKHWFAADPVDYEVRHRFMDPLDLVGRFDLNTGDPRDNTIKYLVNSLKFDREQRDYESLKE